MSLEAVPARPPDPAPYPADTRAGNYAMRLDMARVEQSATYILASKPECPPELRPWLLFLWAKSWQQIPMATLPDSDELVAALIGMPMPYFALHKKTLMRGWKRHADGRLYHDYLTGLVLATLRERARFKRHRDSESEATTNTIPKFSGAQPIDNALRNVAPPLPLRADVDVKVEATTNSAPKPVDNFATVARSWAQHWTAQGKALGIKANPGESEGDYCRRVMERIRGP